MSDPDLPAGPDLVIARASAAGLMIATAESLTGGALVSRLVDVPGASRCLAGGAACYSYTAKSRVLGVDAAMLERDGAVNETTARQMAEGALDAYAADVAVSTTGVAGPGPDGRGVPAGTVHIAVARRGGGTRALVLQLDGDRTEVRAQAVAAALDALARALPEVPASA